MIRLKSAEDIARLAEGGAILGGILDELERDLVVGAVPVDLDARARKLLAEADCTPAFLDYAPGGHKPFPAALCVSVNHAVVHGLPNKLSLEEGDVVGIDLGLVYQGKYYLDSARTAGIGSFSKEADTLMNVTRDALRIGIEQAQVGGRIGDIGAAVQKHVEGLGFELVRQLVGHGVGFGVHEPPQVPNFGKAGTGDLMEEGLVIAIEPMVSIGDATIVTGADGWTVETVGGGLAAHEEHTVAVTAQGPHVLTARPKK